MEKDSWKYTLDIQYSDYATEPRDKPRVRMYFNALSDAFERLLTIYPNYYRQGIWKTARTDLPLTDYPFSEVRISTLKGEQLLAARLIKDTDTVSQVKAKGLYYFFAGGVQNFEKRLGISLSDFKDYAPDASHLLVSYLTSGENFAFKDSRGYRNRVDALEKNAAPGLQFNVTYNFLHFGTNNAAREPTLPLFHEVFYFNNPEDALRKLLQTDFTMLDEEIAWDNDLLAFYCRADAIDGGSRRASIFVTDAPHRRYGDTNYKEPGAYLEYLGKPKDSEILQKITTLAVPNNWSYRSSFHLATFDAKRSVFQNRSEYNNLLQQWSNSKKRKAVRLTRNKEAKKSNAPPARNNTSPKRKSRGPGL